MDLQIEDKHITIICDSDKDELPAVIVNSFQNEAEELYAECVKAGVNDFILISVSNINWNDDMSPWYMDPLFKREDPYLGKADEYLDLLVNRIVPETERYISDTLHKKIAYYAIAGYSLAGLFALYAAYRTDLFRRVMSASGSMWYPGFLEYVEEHEIAKNVDRIYFSLGNRESDTKHELMCKVEDHTVRICEHLSRSADAFYEENEGNHFKDPLSRMAKGIRYILKS